MQETPDGGIPLTPPALTAEPEPTAVATLPTATIIVAPSATEPPTSTPPPPTPPAIATRPPAPVAPIPTLAPPVPAAQAPIAAALSGSRLAGWRICLDPGHDRAFTPGAVGRDAAGRVVLDETLMTLDVAYRLKALLEAEGASVCVTRGTDGALAAQPYDFNGNGTVRAAVDAAEWTQPRIDVMNVFAADLVLSIHFNGFGDSRVSGTEAYFSDTGASGESNRRLASDIVDSLVDGLAESGYTPVNRGVRSDRYKTEYRAFAPAYGFPESCSDCLRLFTLGNNPMSAQQGTWRAGALAEVLFLSNPADVGFLTRADAPDIIAGALAQGVLRYADE